MSVRRWVSTVVAVAAVAAHGTPAFAQNRFAFGFLDGAQAAQDGRAYLLVNGNKFNSINRGKYYASGTTDGNRNFITGLNGSAESRGWFLFDLSILQGSTVPVSSASLTLFNCSASTCPSGAADGYDSPNASEVFSIFDFLGATSGLLDGTGGSAAFTDLGSGSLFGSAVVSKASNGNFVTFDFNTAGRAAVANAIGSQIAVGSALGGTAPDPTPTPTPAPTPPPISSVPEPSTYLLMTVGLLGIFGLSRRRQSATAMSLG